MNRQEERCVLSLAAEELPPQPCGITHTRAHAHARARTRPG